MLIKSHHYLCKQNARQVLDYHPNQTLQGGPHPDHPIPAPAAATVLAAAAAAAAAGIQRDRSLWSSIRCCCWQILRGWWARLVQLYPKEIRVGRQHYPKWTRWEKGLFQVCNITGSASFPQAVDELLPGLAFRQPLMPFA